MDDWKTFTGRLLWAMNRAGKTNQSELARAVGVKPQSIQYLCRAGSGAQGSTHTPALARELRVSADWLAEGQGQPAALESARLRLDESAPTAYSVGPPSIARVKGTLRFDSAGRAELTQAEAGTHEGQVLTPIVAAHLHALRIKGQALAPYVKDGQFLLLQAAPNDLGPEEVVVITLADGQTLVRELMHGRDGSLVVLPVLGGQAEVIDAAHIQRIDLVVSVVARRWWQAG